MHHLRVDRYWPHKKFSGAMCIYTCIDKPQICTVQRNAPIIYIPTLLESIPSVCVLHTFSYLYTHTLHKLYIHSYVYKILLYNVYSEIRNLVRSPKVQYDQKVLNRFLFFLKMHFFVQIAHLDNFSFSCRKMEFWSALLNELAGSKWLCSTEIDKLYLHWVAPNRVHL